MFENAVLVLGQFSDDLVDFLHIASDADGAQFVSVLESSLNLAVRSFQGIYKSTSF